MKICLIGCGDIAEKMHAPACLQYKGNHPDFDMAACCDMDGARAASVRRRFGFGRYYTDYRVMIREEKPDAMLVAVSETASVNVGVDILRAGVPMLIEKPPGRRCADTARLIAASNESHTPCQVAFNRRYMPVLTAMRGRAPEKIQLITYEMIRCNRRDQNFSNTAVHAIDAVRYLANADYRRVRFHYYEMPEYGGGVCNILMDCEMTSGAEAQIRICPMSGAMLERAAVHAENRLILGFTPVFGAHDTPGYVEDYRDNQPPEIIRFPLKEVYQSNGFYQEDEAFFNAVSAGENPQVSVQTAMNTMYIKEYLDLRKAEFDSDRQ